MKADNLVMSAAPEFVERLWLRFGLLIRWNGLAFNR